MNKIQTLAQQLSDVAEQKEQLLLKEETIKALLLVEMKNAATDKETFDFGSINLSTRKTYKFSEAIVKLAEKIKIKMDDEVKQGIAETKVTEFITFRKPSTK